MRNLKKMMFIITLLSIVLGTVLFAADGNGDPLTLPGWLSILVSIISFGIGVFVPKNAQGKVQIGKEVAEGLVRSGYALYKAKQEESDGGKRVTSEEWEVILEQVFQGAKDVAGEMGKDFEDFKE